MERYKPCELISWARFQNLSRLLANKIRQSKFEPEIIVAIGRGGYMPARLLSDYFGNMDLTSFKIEHYRGSQKHATAVVQYPLIANVQDRRVLLVDDVSDSGDTFQVAIEHVSQCGTPAELKTAVLHHKTTSNYLPDYYAQKIIKWRWIIYPWAITEDIGSFVGSELTLPVSVEQIAAHMKSYHGISVTEQQIQDALALLHESSVT